MLTSEQPVLKRSELSLSPSLQRISRELSALHISFRPIEIARDADFLFQVYSSTREAELSVVDWPGAQKSEFLHMQFEAQHVYYQTHYPSAEFLAICERKNPIGRLYIDLRAHEFRILDITLLNRFRGKGIGSSVLTSVLKLAHREAFSVSTLVERYNPAVRLYRRLGFRQCRDVGVSCLMEWTGPS